MGRLKVDGLQCLSGCRRRGLMLHRRHITRDVRCTGYPEPSGQRSRMRAIEIQCQPVWGTLMLGLFWDNRYPTENTRQFGTAPEYVSANRVQASWQRGTIASRGLQASTLVARLMFDLFLLAETKLPFSARRCSPRKSAGHAPASLLMLLVQRFFEVDAEGCFHGGRGKSWRCSVVM